ncbi:unnamed protein product [Oikopleura dioica]|uniref:Uncharacterized protein n=1 Tax=Oikopleura dioica TaxID=34765 RepID=E4XWG3_OIKDI|nr:unnamed protein product [Oikopleura dioica]
MRYNTHLIINRNFFRVGFLKSPFLKCQKESNPRPDEWQPLPPSSRRRRRLKSRTLSSKSDRRTSESVRISSLSEILLDSSDGQNTSDFSVRRPFSRSD